MSDARRDYKRYEWGTLSVALAILLGAGPWAVPAEAQTSQWNAKQIQAHNAARIDNGGRISLELIGSGAGKDKVTMPEDSVDGNPHTRCVTWGTPIQYRIELVASLPVIEINFICEDSAVSESPKDIEVTLSDGTVVQKTLEVIRPSKENRFPRQTIDVGGKPLEWVEVKILSTWPGPLNEKTGKRINYGGIGEIEVITSADLAPYLTVTDYDAAAPTYIEGGSPRNDYSTVKVSMPPKIPLGQFPGLFLTRPEIVAMREKLLANPEGKASYDRLITSCDGWLKDPVVHPDPNVPAQMKDRGDAQAKAHDLLAKKAGWFGWAWQLTDNEAYAEKAREILVGYARLYPNDYKEHKGVHSGDTSKIMAQRLSEAMWIIPLIQSYDLVHDAKCMTDADRKLIEEDLVRTCITFINGKRPADEEVARRDKQNAAWRTEDPTGPKKTVGNWTNFYNAAYVEGGIVLGDQNWIDIGMANTRSNLHTGIGNDGMWGEGAIGYHLFGRRALIACVEPLARKGVDLYGFETCIYKNLFDSPLKYAYPDGTAPGINDSGRAAIGGSYEAMDYDYAYLRYRDPNYGSIVNAAPRQIFPSASVYFPTVIYGHLPEAPIEGLQSLIFDSLGYAILRGKDGGSGTYVLMDYGPHGGGHGHPDKLNLILFADGDELAGEPQGYRYEDPRHAEWTRPTVAHWDLAVDMHQQSPCTGKLLAFKDFGPVKVMRGTSDKAWAGVAIDRTVVQMPGYVADIYRAWGPAEHSYDYALCFRGRLDVLADFDAAALKPMGPSTMRGYKHIMAAGPGTVSGNWSATWARPELKIEAGQTFDETVPNDDRHSHPANEVKATVVAAPGTEAYIGTVPGGRHQAVLRRTGKEAVFAAVIDPYKATDAVKNAEQFAVAGPVPAYGLKVTRDDGGTDLVIVRWGVEAEGKLVPASTGAGVSTNGLVTVVRKDASGKLRNMYLIGGTTCTVGDQTISLPAPGIAGK